MELFLMDNLPVVKSSVEKLSNNLMVPVSCKIHVFLKLDDTIDRMLKDVHERTRDQKDHRTVRTDWKIIKFVRETFNIQEVLVNGNVRHIDDVHNYLKETGCEGILSAETLFQNPALFASYHTPEWSINDDDGE